MITTVEILNEIHEAHDDLPTPIQNFVHPLVADAKALVNAENPDQAGYYYRPHLVTAAAALVQAIEALDKGRETHR